MYRVIEKYDVYGCTKIWIQGCFYFSWGKNNVLRLVDFGGDVLTSSVGCIDGFNWRVLVSVVIFVAFCCFFVAFFVAIGRS